MYRDGSVGLVTLTYSTGAKAAHHPSSSVFKWEPSTLLSLIGPTSSVKFTLSVSMAFTFRDDSLVVVKGQLSVLFQKRNIANQCG